MNNRENELASIYQKLNEQEQELNKLRQAIAGLSGRSNGSPVSVSASNATTDRRGMLKTVAGLAVRVATVGLLRPNSSEAARNSGRQAGARASSAINKRTGAPAATGSDWVLGTDNDADMPTGLANSTFDLIDTQLLIRNYGTTDFVQPAATNIAVVGYCDDEGSTTSQPGLVGLWGETRSIFGATATGVYGRGSSRGGH